MINLAPNHKRGLIVESPILLAGGTIGYGEAVYSGELLQGLGAIVVGPVGRNGRGGAPPPRLAHLPGGAVLNTGQQSRGVDRVVHSFASLWPRFACPVLVQIDVNQPHAVTQIVSALSQIDGVSGMELRLPPHIKAADVSALVHSAVHATDLPIWIKPSLVRPSLLSKVVTECVAAGCAAVTLGQSIRGSAQPSAPHSARPFVSGALLGPLTFAPVMHALRRVAALDLGVPLIACGGVHTVEQVQQALDAGAAAVQIDSALWIEPGLPRRLARAFRVEE